MSAATTSWVLGLRDLRHREFRLLIHLCECASEGVIPGTTVSRLAERCEMTRDQVEDAILALNRLRVLHNVWIDTRGVEENTVRGYLRPEDER